MASRVGPFECVCKFLSLRVPVHRARLCPATGEVLRLCVPGRAYRVEPAAAGPYGDVLALCQRASMQLSTAMMAAATSILGFATAALRRGCVMLIRGVALFRVERAPSLSQRL